MNIAGVIGVVLWVVGICLASHQAAAAGKADGVVPLLCVPLTVTECGLKASVNAARRRV
ncbi:MAG: hypothetical protein ACRERE_28530 [Candidatus Entotheonellia bacterium]